MTRNLSSPYAPGTPLGRHAGWSLVLGLTVVAPLLAAPRLQIVDSVIDEMMDEWRTPGAVVAVIDDGVVVHRAAYGLANRETGEPVVFDQTQFRLASLSKPVTAVAVMRLLEAGQLDLDDPIAPLLGDLEIHLASGTSLRHLLTHTAGFEDRFLLRFARSREEMGELGDYLGASLPRQRYRPGEVSLYSNHGLALAGLVMARVANLTYEEAMRELVFDPLGLESASFDPWSAGETLAQGYRRGEPVPVLGIRTVPASMLTASGADMVELMTALTTPEESTFLSADTMSLMLSRQFAHHPTLPGRALGWSEDSSRTPRLLLHSGATDGFSSALVLVPDHHGGVLVATNANTWVWGAVRKILDELFSSPDEAAAPSDLAESEARADELERPRSGRYVPAQIPTSSLDKARLLFEQTRAEVSNGHVAFRGRRYAPAVLDGDDAWRSPDGAMLVARRGSRGESFLFEIGETWVRLPWHAGWPVHLALVAALLILWSWLVSRGLWGKLRPVEQQNEQREQRVDQPGAQRSQRRLMVAGAATNLLFLFGMAGFFAISMARDGGSLRTHVPWQLLFLLCLPWLSLGLAVVSGWLLVLGRHRAQALLWWELAASYLGLGVFFFWIDYWNLLGLRL